MSDSDMQFGERPVVILRYVPHSRVRDYEAIGWTDLGALPRPHGDYACLMEWRNDGEPVEPEEDPI